VPGLGNAVAMVPVEASGRQHHGVAKIDTAIITWQEGRVTISRVPVSSCTYVGHCNTLRQVPIRSMVEFSTE
jgi:hypothetical protein